MKGSTNYFWFVLSFFLSLYEEEENAFLKGPTLYLVPFECM